MVCDELELVLPRLFEPQQHHQRLLQPERKLQEVVSLSSLLICQCGYFKPQMLELYHQLSWKDNDVKTERSGTSPVEHRVALFVKRACLDSLLIPHHLGEGFEDVQRRRLTQERKHNDVEDEEEQIVVALLVARLVALGRSRDEVLQRPLNRVPWAQGCSESPATADAVGEHEERRNRVVFGCADEEVPVEIREHKDERKLKRRGWPVIHRKVARSLMRPLER